MNTGGIDTKHSHYHNGDVLKAGLAGILAGAAAITALILADKDIRKKVGQRAHEARSTLQDWSAEKLHMVDHKVHTAEQKMNKEKVNEGINEEEPLKNVAMRN